MNLDLSVIHIVGIKAMSTMFWSWFHFNMMTLFLSYFKATSISRATLINEVRSFMGLVGYYRRFIRNFSWNFYTVTSLQRKGKKFEWTEECATNFEQLKQWLTNALVLKVADRDKEFLVCTNACKRGLGGFLMQEGMWYAMSLGN